jgi:hypothetical protein
MWPSTKFSPLHEVMASKSAADCDRAGKYAFDEFVHNEAIPKLSSKDKPQNAA